MYNHFSPLQKYRALDLSSRPPCFEPKRLNTQRAGPARLLPGMAGTDLIFQWIGMLEYILFYGGPAGHWGPLPATRLASRKILIDQNIKKRTGPALCSLCGLNHLSLRSHFVSTYISTSYSYQCTEASMAVPWNRELLEWRGIQR